MNKCVHYFKLSKVCIIIDKGPKYYEEDNDDGDRRLSDDQEEW